MFTLDQFFRSKRGIIIPREGSRRDDRFIKFPDLCCRRCTILYHGYTTPMIPPMLTNLCTDRPTEPGNKAPRNFGGCVTVIYNTTRTPYAKFRIAPFLQPRPFRYLRKTPDACDNEEPLHIYNVNLVRLRISAGPFDKDGGTVETIARSQLKLREYKNRGLNELFNNLRDGILFTRHKL